MRKKGLAILLLVMSILSSGTKALAAGDTNTLYLQIGDQTLTATLVENSATEALKEALENNPIKQSAERA